MRAGQRTDRIDRHTVMTIHHRFPDGVRLSCTVFSGLPVSVQARAAAVVLGGVALRSFATSQDISVVRLVRPRA